MRPQGKALALFVQSAYVKQDVDAKQTEIQSLKSEIKGRKSLVAAVVSKPAQDMSTSTEKTPPNAVSNDCSSNSEITALKNKQTDEAPATETQKESG